LNPLDRDEGFQITSSSSLWTFPGATSATLHNTLHNKGHHAPSRQPVDWSRLQL
jgi:hypothetical protein